MYVVYNAIRKETEMFKDYEDAKGYLREWLAERKCTVHGWDYDIEKNYIAKLVASVEACAENESDLPSEAIYVGKIKDKVCTWSFNGDCYETECGKGFELGNLETLAENNFRYCHYCGRRIKENAYIKSQHKERRR